jgi:C-terminal processing protease CtpA/Prc
VQQEAARLAASGWVGVELLCREQGQPYKVSMVIPDTPADKAGLRPGDVLVAMNGIAIPDCSQDTLGKINRDAKPGQSVTYTIKRDGVDREIALTLEPICADVLAKYLGERARDRATAEKGP